MAPAVDIADDSFVVVDRGELAARFADPGLCRRWWPDLDLTVVQDRGPAGVRWSVSGALVGSAEVWLEPWRDGVVVHWFLRADPASRTARSADRIRRAYVMAWKRRIHQLKDELERGRPAGAPRQGTVRSPRH